MKKTLNKLLLHHIGIATADMDSSILVYEQLGYTSSKIYRDKIQEVDLSFLRKDGETIIELVSPYKSGSPIEAILKKNGTVPYHICYEVVSIDETIKELRKLKFIQVSQKVPAIAFNNREICFLYHKNFGTLELLQK